MNHFLLRRVPAAVLCLPLLALAQAGRTDPADPKTPAPALRYQSAFADYKPWQELKPGDWRAVNAGVGGAHAGHEMPADQPASAPAPRATMPAMPGHGSHHMDGGKQ